MPPVAVPVKVTLWPGVGDEALKVKLVERGGGLVVVKNSVIGVA